MSERLALPPLPPSIDVYEAVQACRVTFLRHLARALGEAGGAAPSAVETACLAAGDFFDESVAARRAGFEQAHGLTASKISLVCDDQLELEILLGDMVKRLGEACSGTLWRLYLRFATLLRRPDLLAADLPVGPQGICQGLGAMCASLDGGLPRWTPLLQGVEEALAEQLPAIYGELNDLLAKLGVEAAQMLNQPAQKVKTASDGAGALAAGPASDLPGNPASALQQALLGRTGALPDNPGGAAGSTLIPLEVLNQLLSRLDTLERLEATATPVPTPEQPVVSAVKPSQLGIPANRPEAVAIDALALIFEAIFSDPALPDAIKSAIASLQIPFLKSALLDPAFFSGDHPARLLLDRMAGAALGLNRDASPHDPVCIRLQEMAAHVRNGFDGSTGVFEQAVATVEALIARRNGEIDRLAQSHLPLVDSLARRQAAGRAAGDALAPLLAGDVPPAIAAFLDTHWRRYLQVLWLESGNASPAWAAALGVAEDLLWSVQRKEGTDDRRRLAQLVPSLLRGLNAGLDRIGVGQEEKAPFLDACFALQTAAIRPPATPPAASSREQVVAPSRPLSAEVARSQLDTVSADGRTLLVFDLPGQAASAALLAAPPWKVGDWIEVRLPGGDVACARLATLTADGWPLFANPAWNHALLVAPLILERQLRTGEATVQVATSLFDAAASKALGVMTGSG